MIITKGKASGRPGFSFMGTAEEDRRGNTRRSREVEATPFDFYGHRGVGAAEMAYAIRRGRPNRCSKEYGLHCLEVLTAMDESAAAGKAVAIQSRCEMKPLKPGYYSSVGFGRGDAELSLVE